MISVNPALNSLSCSCLNCLRRFRHLRDFSIIFVKGDPHANHSFGEPWVGLAPVQNEKLEAAHQNRNTMTVSVGKQPPQGRVACLCSFSRLGRKPPPAKNATYHHRSLLLLGRGPQNAGKARNISPEASRGKEVNPCHRAHSEPTGSAVFMVGTSLPWKTCLNLSR